MLPSTYTLKSMTSNLQNLAISLTGRGQFCGWGPDLAKLNLDAVGMIAENTATSGFSVTSI